MNTMKCAFGFAMAFSLTLGFAVNSASAQRPGDGPPGFVKARIMFALMDANGDKALSEDEVPGRAWEHLSAADGNKDGSVTQLEIKELVATRIFSEFDENEAESLTEDEVPGRMWNRLSKADADENGAVTKEEFIAAEPPSRGGKRSDR